LRDEDKGTLVLNLFAALEAPIVLLLITGHDATSVLVVVLYVVVSVVDEVVEVGVVTGTIEEQHPLW
jgi:hypothetical protein